LLSLSTPDRPVCQDQYVPRCGDLLCRHVRKQYTRLAVEDQHARCKLVKRFQRKLFLFAALFEEKPQLHRPPQVWKQFLRRLKLCRRERSARGRAGDIHQDVELRRVVDDQEGSMGDAPGLENLTVEVRAAHLIERDK
jgi:hypothetical protein